MGQTVPVPSLALTLILSGWKRGEEPMHLSQSFELYPFLPLPPISCMPPPRIGCFYVIPSSACAMTKACGGGSRNLNLTGLVILKVFSRRSTESEIYTSRSGRPIRRISDGGLRMLFVTKT